MLRISTVNKHSENDKYYKYIFFIIISRVKRVLHAYEYSKFRSLIMWKR